MTPRYHYRESRAIAPICQVKKEVYVPSPEPRVGTSVSMTYIGRRRRREEVRSLIRSSDWADTVRRRTSEDNCKNWSDWELEYKQAPTQGEFTQEGGESQRGTGPYDPVSCRLIKPVFQRIITGKPQVAMKELWSGNRLFCDHGFYQLSDDDGRTWGKAHQLKYEEGPSFKKDTVTVIDDRDPEQDSGHLQLSNFSLLEKRETQEKDVPIYPVDISHFSTVAVMLFTYHMPYIIE